MLSVMAAQIKLTEMWKAKYDPQYPIKRKTRETQEEGIETRAQFHQRSTRSFYVCKLRAQLFCAYILALYSTGVSLPAQKLRVERW